MERSVVSDWHSNQEQLHDQECAASSLSRQVVQLSSPSKKPLLRAENITEILSSVSMQRTTTDCGVQPQMTQPHTLPILKAQVKSLRRGLQGSQSQRTRKSAASIWKESRTHEMSTTWLLKISTPPADIEGWSIEGSIPRQRTTDNEWPLREDMERACEGYLPSLVIHVM